VLRTPAETLRDYYRHPEWKSGDPQGVGTLPRRQVVVLRHKAIGKETNRQALVPAEDTDGVVGGEEASADAAQEFDVGDVSELLQRYSVAELVRATGLPRRTIYGLRSTLVKEPRPETVEAIRRAVTALRS
jgi:hypothetical protein